MSVRVAEGLPLPEGVAGTRGEWCHIKGAPRDPSDRTSLLWWTEDATERDPIIAWIGMNPSCADEHHSDKTCHVCWYTSRREGFKRYMMLNLFSAPATDPPDLLVYSGRPGNHVEVAHLAREAHRSGGKVVAAWGALSGTPDLQRLLRARRDALLPLLDGVPLWCLGTTLDGSPKHPSRLGYGVPMVPWVRTSQ